ncbi:opioid-binding protein/cell adhesion molecule homolog [Macrobrachium rosenbergii]|uniref:opioid-binding protein/cell adhesion molecule homolog n=1 Tax=Macrobrachium rosenbergii TaxID=79674 RepID=UPI0034D4D67B
MAPKRVTVDEGGSTVITCSAIGNPAPNITWSIQDNNSSIREVSSWGISEARLLVDFVTRADTGFYRCQASNVVGTSKLVKTAVVVTQAPEPLEEEPLRDELPSRPWAKLGGTGRLECFVKAAPAPNFRWTINEDRVLFNSRKYFVRGPHLVDGIAEWSSVLEIRSVTDKDYTTYTCTASNYMGTLTSNHMLGPAIPPHQAYNLSVASVTGTTAFLTWIPPSQGTAPSGYTLRYRPLHDEEYLPKTADRVSTCGQQTTIFVDALLQSGPKHQLPKETSSKSNCCWVSTCGQQTTIFVDALLSLGPNTGCPRNVLKVILLLVLKSPHPQENNLLYMPNLTKGWRHANTDLSAIMCDRGISSTDGSLFQ